MILFWIIIMSGLKIMRLVVILYTMTCVELKDIKDVKDTIYSMKPCIGIITAEVAK